MIEVRGLRKKYGSKEVLKGINLTLEKGGVYGLVGENGSGKTTLFRCLAGLESYGGVLHSPWKPLKDYLGFLVTQPFFLSKMTGFEYLQLLCNARGIESVDFEDKNIFDLPLKEYASTYSTGMKKKLALLGVLLQQNEVFILDEPFNGVDIQSNILITELIHELKRLGKTILISSHIFSTLTATCDRIYVLKEGVIQKNVLKKNFQHLAAEMRDSSIGTKIRKISLQ